MKRDRTLKNLFGKVSDVYDSARPGYHDKLITDIISISGINKTSSILDVGCGSGKATKLFGQKGYNILGIDISYELIKIAKKNSQNFQNISYKFSSFEDLFLPQNTLDLIISAQAWHWLNPNIAYKKAHNLLTKNGFLALFWKVQQYRKLSFLANLRELYIKHCPKYHNPEAVKSAEKEISESKFFYNLEKKEYFIDIEYSKQKYTQMVSTMSWVIALSKKDKDVFFSNLSRLLEPEPEVLRIPYKYTLLIAKNNPSSDF